MPPPVQFDPSKPFTFVEDEKEKKEAKFDPSKPFTFVEEEPEPLPSFPLPTVKSLRGEEEDPLQKAAIPAAEIDEPFRAAVMDEFAKESDLRGAVRKSWATPLQPTEAARGMSQKPRFTDGDWSEWERDFGVMLEAAQRVRSAEGVEDRTRATTDYAKAAMKVRTRPKYAEMFNPEIQSTDRQDSVKKFDSRHNALAIREADSSLQEWVHTGVLQERDKATDKELLDNFNRRYETDFTDLDDARIWIEKRTEKSESEAKGYGRKSTALKAAHLGTALFSWPDHLKIVGEGTGALLGEAYSGAKELQARAGGKTYKDSGKYTEAFLQGQKYGEGDLTFDELLEHKGVSPYGRGLAQGGQVVPDIAAGIYLTPMVAAQLKAMRLPAATVSRWEVPATFGSLFGGKELGVTRGDWGSAMKSGLMGAVIPGIHKLGAESAGTLIKSMLKKDLTSKGKFRAAAAQELVGLGSVFALMESENIGPYLEADDARRKEMIVEFLGRATVFGLPIKYAAKQRVAREELKAVLESNEIVSDIQREVERLWDAKETHKDGAAEVGKRQEAAAGALETLQKGAKKAQELMSKSKKGEGEALVERMKLDKLKAEKPPPVEAEGLDVSYDRAVKAGDRVAQKALVDEAAKAAGYDSGVVFHATPFKFTEFDRAKIARADADTNVSGFFFSKKPHVRAAMAQGSVERGPKLPENRIISSYLKLGRTTTRANAESIISKKAGEWFLDKDGNPKSLEELKAQGGDRIGNPPSDFYWPEGFDSVKFSKDTWIVRDPSQIKAAADIVRDNAGNVIPLSERFGLKAPKPPTPDALSKAGEIADLLREKEGVRLERDKDKVRGIDVARGDEVLGHYLRVFREKKAKEDAALTAQTKEKILEAEKSRKESEGLIDKIRAWRDAPAGEKAAEGLKGDKPPPPAESPLTTGGEHMRAFAKRYIKRLEDMGEADMAQQRAAHLKENPKAFYDRLNSSEAKASMQAMEEKAFEKFASERELYGEEWQTAINIEMARRAELKGDFGKADTIIEGLMQRLTTYGQSVQQATHLGMSPRGIVKMVNAELEKQGANPLTKPQEAKMRKLVQKAQTLEDSFRAAEETWRKDKTNKNLTDLKKAWVAAELAARDQAVYSYRFNRRGWADIAVTQIQGNLLSPASFVLNFGANVFMRPVRAATRGTGEAVGPILDLFYATTVGKFKGTPAGKAIKDIQLPSPWKGTKRTLRGFMEGMFSKDPDWKGAESALTVLKRGATQSPYEAKGISLNPANAQLALKQLAAMLEGDAISHPSSFKQLNEWAKASFEASFGWPADISFRLLHAGDVGWRKAAEHRVIGRLIDKKLATRNLSKAERDHLTEAAMQDPRLVFDAKEVEWIKQQAAKDVYQQDNAITDFVGEIMGGLRKGKLRKGEFPLAQKAGHLALRTLAPYQKTPINVMAEVVSYTPAGAALNLIAKAAPYGKKGEVSEQQRIEVREAAGRLGVALVLSNIATTMADYGLIQPSMIGRDQPDTRKKRLFRSGHGLPASHVNMSGTTRWLPLYFKGLKLRSLQAAKPTKARELEIEMLEAKMKEAAKFRDDDGVADANRVGALGWALIVNVNAHRKLQELPAEQRELHDRLLARGVAHLSSATQFTASQAYTQTLAEAGNLAMGKEGVDAASFFSKLGETVSAIAIPRTFSWWDMVNEEHRPTYRNDEFGDQLRNKFQAKVDSIAGLFNLVGVGVPRIGKSREDLPKIRDFRGEKVLRTPDNDLYVLGQKVSPAVWHLFGMAKHHRRGKKYRYRRDGVVVPDAAAWVMDELHRTLKDDRGRPDMSVIPSPILPVIQEKGAEAQITYKLTPDQYDEYAKLVGEMRFKGVPEKVWLAHGHDDPPEWSGMDKMAESSKFAVLMKEDPERAAYYVRKNLRRGTLYAKEKFLDKNRKNLKIVPNVVGLDEW